MDTAVIRSPLAPEDRRGKTLHKHELPPWPPTSPSEHFEPSGLEAHIKQQLSSRQYTIITKEAPSNQSVGSFTRLCTFLQLKVAFKSGTLSLLT
ncbi:hypothetical protein RvY_17056 [Ramazzottius varieornatus]|uniref:Uncharacterized protein n=1 Tax=Ramazzottius varieornatus TaxID=947166 RepID=A0A1D1W368_RAMVA|nr:hypothetical protein RvY_17056 [Ramazzottius varieornatus]